MSTGADEWRCVGELSNWLLYWYCTVHIRFRAERDLVKFDLQYLNDESWQVLGDERGGWWWSIYVLYFNSDVLDIVSRALYQILVQ